MTTRRNLAAAAAMASFASMLRARGTELPTTVMQPEGSKRIATPFGELAVYFDGPTGQLAYMQAGTVMLKPGQEPHPPHTHPEEEFLVVMTGTGEIVVEGKTYEAKPGSVMYSAGDKSHGIKNTGRRNLTFFYCKWRDR